MATQKLHSEYRSTYRWHEYKPSHDVIKKAPEPGGMVQNAVEEVTTTIDTRARSEERGNLKQKGGRRSHSEGPLARQQRSERFAFLNRQSSSGPDVSQPLLQTCTHTEYQLQFAWPRSSESTPRHDQNAASVPKKSKSMGAIQPARTHQPVTRKDKGSSQSLDELHGEEKAQMEAKDMGERAKRRQYKSEYRKKFRPFSAYQYVDGRWMKLKEADGSPWYTEVAEMRKKAGEYKNRGWESSLTPEHMADIYKKQIALMEHISRRSSLSALALATPSPSHDSIRPITKEEKEKENRKSMPTSTRGSPRTPSFRPPPLRSKRDSPKKKEQEKPEARKPPTGRETRTPPKHLEKTTGARSASQGQENQSPKRNRPQSAAPAVGGWKIHLQEGETRRPRPTTLSTTASRPKPRTVSAKRADEGSKPRKSKKPIDEGKKEGSVIGRRSRSVCSRLNRKDAQAVADEEPPELPEPSEEATTEPEPDIPKPKHDAYERVMKSPPEPTRVRSPEQAMTKSPDPVNWTVPLDTGKMFTVTQRVPEGEAAKVQTPHKIQSPQHTGSPKRTFTPAGKTSTPYKMDSPIATSRASEELRNGMRTDCDRPPSPLRDSLDSEPKVVEAPSGMPSDVMYQPPDIPYKVAPSSYKQQESPPSLISPSSIATDVLEKARTRFDKFWGKGKDKDEK